MSGVALEWTSWVLVASGLLCVVRIVLGPRSADRLAALSALSGAVLALLVIRGTLEGRSLYLDVALVYAILGFLGLLAISAFIVGSRSGGGR